MPCGVHVMWDFIVSAWVSVGAVLGYWPLVALAVVIGLFNVGERLNSDRVRGLSGIGLLILVAACAAAAMVPEARRARAVLELERQAGAHAPSVGALTDRRGAVAFTIKKPISRAIWGDRWPLTVDYAVLVCLRQAEDYGQFLVAGGRAWAVNGASSAYARQHGLGIEIDGTRREIASMDVGDADAAAVWAKAGWSLAGQEARKDWSAMISAARDLGCRPPFRP